MIISVTWNTAIFFDIFRHKHEPHVSGRTVNHSQREVTTNGTVLKRNPRDQCDPISLRSITVPSVIHHRWFKTDSDSGPRQFAPMFYSETVVDMFIFSPISSLTGQGIGCLGAGEVIIQTQTEATVLGGNPRRLDCRSNALPSVGLVGKQSEKTKSPFVT